MAEYLLVGALLVIALVWVVAFAVAVGRARRDSQ
jgi:hypothetical protein